MKKKSIDAATLETAVSEMKTGMVTSLAEYWAGQGADAMEAQEIATLCAEVCGLICQTEFSASETADTPETPAEGDTPAMDTPKNILAGITKTYKEIKAGSIEKAGATWSAANKAKIKEVYGKVKELHDEATASKEESAPEPEKKSAPEPDEVDYDAWVLTQGK